METEKFCLRWNDFETNISTAFKELRDDKDFFDVTLACDDDQIQAHKVILSACSPFFRTILKKNYHAHPLLYLKGIKYKELLSVINFMYHGEVSVAQEDLNAFLLIAEDLRIKGLTQDEKNKKEKRTPHNERIRNAEERKPLVQAPVRIHNSVPASSVSNSQFQNDQDDEIEEVLLVKTEPPENMANPSSLTPANQITALVENNDNTAMYGDQLEEFEDYSGDGAVGYDQGNGGGSTDFNSVLDSMIRSCEAEDSGQIKLMCVSCGKIMARRKDLRRHVETHLDMTHPCGICQKVMKTRSSLAAHYSMYHKNEVSSPWSMI